ncbi:MAG: peptidase M75 [Bacteroidales bacterium]|nr:peptidase M75 [Bacteroidales bacterium]
MKRTFIRLCMAVAVTAMAFLTASCKKENNDTPPEDTSDKTASVVASQFVDHTVAPTYTALAERAEQLASQLAALKAAPTQTGLEEACNTFLAAREEWEKSEAFLFGAAGDFGIDPHIDSWPLDEDAFATLMNSPAMLAALDAEDGDVVAGERLGNALLGFHGIEYILFADGHAKNVSDISASQWTYVAAVAGDLRNRCYQLEVGWLGGKAPASHIAKLDDIELSYTVAGSGNSYGDNMKNAGQAGSTYMSRKAAVMAIVQGCSDIADEVGSSKIYSAWHGEDITYIESPYSQKSIIDFHNNIVSIQNAYLGGVEGQRDDSKSVHAFVKDINSSLDARVITAINNALAKIDAMPAPFVQHYADAANGEAVEACNALSEVLDEVIETIRKN